MGAPTEIAGLILSLWLWVRTRDEPSIAYNYIFAAVLYCGMLLSFFLLNDPVNLDLRSWTRMTLPADWANYRASWELGHALAGFFSLCALVALLRAFAQAERYGGED